MAKAPETKETKKTGTEVSTSVKNTALADAPPQELAAFMDEDAGKGVSTSSNDVGIPFLVILQDLSPQVKKRDEKYIDGAEVGMIMNNASQEIYASEDGILFIPCFFKSALVEWVPRDSGGGYVKEYPIDDPIMRRTTRPDRKKPPKLENGNDLVETRYYFGLHAKPDGTYEPAVIGMASSALKISREWMRQLKLVKTPGGAIAPSFAKAWRLKTKLAKNNAGQEYFTWSINAERWVNSEEYAAGRTLEAECARGNVQASRPDESVGASSGSDEEVL